MVSSWWLRRKDLLAEAGAVGLRRWGTDLPVLWSGEKEMTGDGSTRLEGGRKWWNRLKVEGDEQIEEGEAGNSLKNGRRRWEIKPAGLGA